MDRRELLKKMASLAIDVVGEDDLDDTLFGIFKGLLEIAKKGKENKESDE